MSSHFRPAGNLSNRRSKASTIARPRRGILSRALLVAATAMLAACSFGPTSYTKTVTRAAADTDTTFLARRAGVDAVGLVADRRRYRHDRRNRARELVAVGVAVLDSYLGVGPRHLGERISIEGDGRVTHDRWTE